MTRKQFDKQVLIMSSQAPKKLLIIADPLENLNKTTDTTLFFAERALDQGWHVFWCEPQDILIWKEMVTICRCQKLSDTTNFNLANSNRMHGFSEYDACFLRKDPPFDKTYKALCWMLATQTKVRILNPPEKLLQFHEKFLPWRVFHEGYLDKKNLIPTCLSFETQTLFQFIEEFPGKSFVIKPWMGHGGKDIQKFSDGNELKKYLVKEEKIHQKKQLKLLQPFLPEIHTAGDRRVFFVDGEIFFHFVRLPPKGSFVANTAQGGGGEIRPMTDEQQKICCCVGHFLRKHDIFFAGMDLIDHYVSEINITSPTGARAFESIAGQKLQFSFERYLP